VATGGDTGGEVVAAIDVGTNTTRLLVAQHRDGRAVPLARGAAMTALGEGLSRTGRIGEAAMTAAEETVGAMAAEARALGASRLVIACTAVARDAANAAELLRRLQGASGVPPRVLSGEEEARIAFRGVLAADAPDPLLAADLGGGSLELMGGRGGRLDWATSLPLGVRLLTERYAPGDPPAVDLVGPISAYARSLVAPVADGHHAAGAIVSGGSAQALATLAGTAELDQTALVRAVDRLAAARSDDLAAETGLTAARVRLCLAGAAVLESVRRAFGLDALRVTEAGLREGLVAELLASREPA